MTAARFPSNVEVNGSELGPGPRFNFCNSCNCMNSGIIEHPHAETMTAEASTTRTGAKTRQENRSMTDTFMEVGEMNTAEGKERRIREGI